MVVQGNVDQSRLVQVQEKQHPGQLSPEELQVVISWIKSGAPQE